MQHASAEALPPYDRAFLLKRALEPWLKEYDFVVIDSPPSLGLLTLNGLVAGSKVLIPLQCEYYAMEGLASLIETVKRVKLSLNPRLELWGIIFTMYDTRTKLSRQVVGEVVRHFPREAFRTVVPRNVRLSEAPSYGIPVLLYDAKSAGARAYLSITKEVLNRCQSGA
jgi:chromosome partitioning protein